MRQVYPSQEGFWGPVTANMDWCESNYEYTFYVAELFNTLSSIPVFLSGAYGLWNTYRYGYAKHFGVSNITIGIAGFGSTVFHGTLLREGQMLDELPMLWLSLAFLYISCTISKTVVLGYGVIATLMYFFASFEIFAVSFGVIMGAAVINTVRSAIHLSKCGYTSFAKYGILGPGVFVLGFLLFWIPEQIWCGNRLESNHYSIFNHLHFHAMWHLTSALGSYNFMIYGVAAYYHKLNRNLSIKMHSALQIPVVHIEVIGSATKTTEYKTREK